MTSKRSSDDDDDDDDPAFLVVVTVDLLVVLIFCFCGERSYDRDDPKKQTSRRLVVCGRRDLYYFTVRRCDCDAGDDGKETRGGETRKRRRENYGRIDDENRFFPDIIYWYIDRWRTRNLRILLLK